MSGFEHLLATCWFTEGEIAFGDIASRRLGLADIVFDEEDLVAVINGEYVVKTPSLEEESQGTPNKRVTWRESLEENFYDTEEERDDCLVVDISSHRSFLSHRLC